MSKNFLRHFPAIGFCFKLSNKVYYNYFLEDVIILELPELEFISMFDYRAVPAKILLVKLQMGG